MAELPLATVARLLKGAGAQRTGSDAAAALVELLEDYAIEVSKKAWNLAQHAGRKTIKAEDIKMAVK